MIIIKAHLYIKDTENIYYTPTTFYIPESKLIVTYDDPAGGSVLEIDGEVHYLSETAAEIDRRIYESRLGVNFTN